MAESPFQIREKCNKPKLALFCALSQFCNNLAPRQLDRMFLLSLAPARSKTMKSNNSHKANAKTKEGADYLAARAAIAEKQAEAARKVARQAKSKFKDARK